VIACPCCGSDRWSSAYSYDRPPEGETAFGIPDSEYAREYRLCGICGHWLGVTELDLRALYEGDYVDATYSAKGVGETFDRIMALPPEASDNTQRVRRITSFFADARAGSVLDVGSGLGVFPARMKEAGWRCTALDPDERATRFARERIGVEAVCADFMSATGLGRFDLVTLNKVLEHVADPAAMLERTIEFLDVGGVVYLEVPDGERASRDPDGAGREEFFIEHLHVFSMSSLCLLVPRAGLDVTVAGRLREPSGKYTLYAFCSLGCG
jgi:SAM-dependent methyltransferase